jgi:hypothetical protein
VICTSKAGLDSMRALSYVLPLKSAGMPSPEFIDYVNGLSAVVEMVVVDASPLPVFHALESHRAPAVRHLRPDADLMSLANGKVRGVLTGLRSATHDAVVIADDDVRYTEQSLDEVARALQHADIVRPQNYFVPLPWHAQLDTARTLINRMSGGDWPGTLAVRRSALGPLGYDGNVLFENLELVRTVRAAGGVESHRPDLFVARRPPTNHHFFSQRVRQAYDEFARPHRLAVALGVVPAAASLLLARRWWTTAALFGLGPMLVAEAGRRRHGGRQVFPVSTVVWAPVWVLERGVSAWLAVGARLLLGGVPYAGGILRVAANPERAIAARVAVARSTVPDSAPRR